METKSPYSPEEVQRSPHFHSFSLDECREIIADYQKLKTGGSLETEIAPRLRNDFDEPGFFEHFKSTISHFSLIPTHQCNLRCTYCVFSGTYEGERVHEGVDMSDEVIDRSVDFIASLGSNAAKVDMKTYGGESLIKWEAIRRFHKKLKAATPASKLFFFKITTNGLLLTPKISEYCIENGIRIQVSLDGPQDVHDRYRVSAGGQPTFSRIFDNIKWIYREAPDYFRRNMSFNAVYGPPYDFKKVNEFFCNEEMFEHHGSRSANFTASHVGTVNTSFFNGKNGFKDSYSEELEGQRELYLQVMEQGRYRHVRFFPRCFSNPC